MTFLANPFWANPCLANLCVVCVVCVVCVCVVCVLCVSCALCAFLFSWVLWCCGGVQDFRGCVQDVGAPSPPPGTPPPPDRPKFRSFFPLPPQFSLFLLYLGGPFVEFWWCFFEGRDPEMCTFGALGLSCEAPAASGPPGPQTPPKFNERTPKREKKRKKIVAAKGKNKREISGPHTSEPHPWGAPPFGAAQIVKPLKH